MKVFFDQVNAPFQVLQPSSTANIDTVFSCSHYHGVVPAESTIKLKVCLHMCSIFVCNKPLMQD